LLQRLQRCVAGIRRLLPVHYVQRHISVVDYQGNMEFGIGREPGDWLASEAEFMSVWLAAQQALAIVSLETYQK
jgi:hypothetical protein